MSSTWVAQRILQGAEAAEDEAADDEGEDGDADEAPEVEEALLQEGS